MATYAAVQGVMAAIIMRERSAAAEALGEFGDSAALAELEKVLAERPGKGTWLQDLLSGDRFLYGNVEKAIKRIRSRMQTGPAGGPQL